MDWICFCIYIGWDFENINVYILGGFKMTPKKSKAKQKKRKIIDFYYDPNLECTCEALFDDTHRSHCKRRIRPR